MVSNNSRNSNQSIQGEPLPSNRMELMAPRCEEGRSTRPFHPAALLPCAFAHMQFPRHRLQIFQTFLCSPLYPCLPLKIAKTSSSPPRSFLSPRGSCTPLWGPPADDSIWQLWSRRDGAQFAPKQRNIVSAKAISTLSETSQSHPPFECKGLAHSSAERGRERKGTAKEKAWGGRGGTHSDRHFGFPERKAEPVQ